MRTIKLGDVRVGQVFQAKETGIEYYRVSLPEDLLFGKGEKVPVLSDRDFAVFFKHKDTLIDIRDENEF